MRRLQGTGAAAETRVELRPLARCGLLLTGAPHPPSEPANPQSQTRETVCEAGRWIPRLEGRSSQWALVLATALAREQQAVGQAPTQLRAPRSPAASGSGLWRSAGLRATAGASVAARQIPVGAGPCGVPACWPHPRRGRAARCQRAARQPTGTPPPRLRWRRGTRTGARVGLHRPRESRGQPVHVLLVRYSGQHQR